ncbi:MAG: hypothetical protein O2960_23545, partial [Verrucomicrobia bacterium]|nr:hypothetical protein [Verrucomicrobiota bacterium]
VRESSAGQAQDSAWQPLFDGKTLDGWKATDFAGSGEVEVQKGELGLNAGVTLTGFPGQTVFRRPTTRAPQSVAPP